MSHDLGEHAAIDQGVRNDLKQSACLNTQGSFRPQVSSATLCEVADAELVLLPLASMIFCSRIRWLLLAARSGMLSSSGPSQLSLALRLSYRVFFRTRTAAGVSPSMWIRVAPRHAAKRCGIAQLRVHRSRGLPPPPCSCRTAVADKRRSCLRGNSAAFLWTDVARMRMFRETKNTPLSAAAATSAEGRGGHPMGVSAHWLSAVPMGGGVK